MKANIIKFKVLEIGGASYIGEGSIESAIEKINSIGTSNQAVLYVNDYPKAFKRAGASKIDAKAVNQLLAEFGGDSCH